MHKLIAILAFSLSACAPDIGSSARTLTANGFATCVDSGWNLQHALDDLPPEGGTVVVPAGCHDLQTYPVRVRSNTRITCEPGARLYNSTGYVLLTLVYYNADNVIIEGCSLEIDDVNNFATAIHGDGAHGLTVRDNTFLFADVAQSIADGGTGYTIGTMYAVSATAGASHVRVFNNESRHGQFKIGGAGSSHLRIKGNTCIDPYDFCVSVVHTDPDAGFDYVEISGNQVRGVTSTGAIFVGADGETRNIGWLRHVRVANNQIGGTWTGRPGADVLSQYGIKVSGAGETVGIVIEGNTISNSGDMPSDGRGIVLKSDASGDRLTATVRGNRIGPGITSYGISGALGAGSRVAGNDLVGSRGLSLELGGDGHVIEANTMSGASDTFKLYGAPGGATRVLVRDNLIETTGAWKTAATFDNTAGPLSGRLQDNEVRASGNGSAPWSPSNGNLYTTLTCVGNYPENC